MTIDELNNCLADMRDKLLAKGYHKPHGSFESNGAGLGKYSIVLLDCINKRFETIGSVYLHECPYEAVTAAYDIIDGLPDLDPAETIKLDLAAAIAAARAAGVDVAAVIGVTHD